MALVISTWLWGDKYSPDDVAKLHCGLRRHLKQPFRFICSTMHCEGAPETIEHGFAGPVTLYEIEPSDQYLLLTKGCFVRLRMFDPAWQKSRGVDDRLVCVDLDTVITGPLDPLFDRPESFLILRGANTQNPCPLNGSLMMLRAGAHPEVWSDFSLEKASKVPFHEFPDDQGWIWHKLPLAHGWECGRNSGVYAFQKNGWPRGNSLPRDARMVVFPGWRSPQQFRLVPWVRRNWAA